MSLDPPRREPLPTPNPGWVVPTPPRSSPNTTRDVWRLIKAMLAVPLLAAVCSLVGLVALIMSEVQSHDLGVDGPYRDPYLDIYNGLAAAIPLWLGGLVLLIRVIVPRGRQLRTYLHTLAVGAAGTLVVVSCVSATWLGSKFPVAVAETLQQTAYLAFFWTQGVMGLLVALRIRSTSPIRSLRWIDNGEGDAAEDDPTLPFRRIFDAPSAH